MAVYEGARPVGLLTPRRPRVADAPTLPRRRARAAVRARRGRTGPVGVVLGGIVVLFLLAFFSLAQSVSVSATGYALDRLAVEHDRLEATQRDLLSTVNRLGSGPAIRKLGLDAGLGQLDNPIVLPAH